MFKIYLFVIIKKVYICVRNAAEFVNSSNGNNRVKISTYMEMHIKFNIFICII